MKVADLVYDKIKPLFTGDIQLVEVEYAKKNDGMHLIVYIEKENGVTVDDCVAVSRLIDEPLEELNPTGDAPYYLDISSYGLDKPLMEQYFTYLKDIVTKFDFGPSLKQRGRDVIDVIKDGMKTSAK